MKKIKNNSLTEFNRRTNMAQCRSTINKDTGQSEGHRGFILPLVVMAGIFLSRVTGHPHEVPVRRDERSGNRVEVEAGSEKTIVLRTAGSPTSPYVHQEGNEPASTAGQALGIGTRIVVYRSPYLAASPPRRLVELLLVELALVYGKWPEHPQGAPS